MINWTHAFSLTMETRMGRRSLRARRAPRLATVLASVLVVGLLGGTGLAGCSSAPKLADLPPDVVAAMPTISAEQAEFVLAARERGAAVTGATVADDLETGTTVCWALQNGEQIEMAAADEPRVEVDHTYIMALVHEPEFTDGGEQYPAKWVSLGSDSVIPYDGTEIGVGEVQGTVLSEPEAPEENAVDRSLEDELTGKRIDELVAALSDATPGARGDFGPSGQTDG